MSEPGNPFNLPTMTEAEQRTAALDRAVEENNKAIKEAERDRILSDKALNILSMGVPLGSLLDAFRLNHQGHEEIARAVIYATVLQSSQTSKGLQLSVVGSKGSGKSSAIKSVVHLIPRSHFLESSFSPKALLYQPIPEKTVLFLDDIVLGEEMVSLIKRAMSNFQHETHHRTVIDKKAVDLAIPRRIVFLGSSVWEAGDDQLKDRCLNIGIANGAKDDQEYYEFERRRREEGRPELITNDDVLVARFILEHIKCREFVVRMCPIEFAYKTDRRLMNIFYDLCEASAILNYLQREHAEEKGIVTVHSNERDVQAAQNFSMFKILNPSSEGRLTRAETAFDDIIQAQIQDSKIESLALTEGDLVHRIGKSLRAVRATLYGKDGSQNRITGGLLDKTPWYSIEEVEGRKEIRIRKKPDTGMRGLFAWVIS
jgi:hypothetical protein